MQVSSSVVVSQIMPCAYWMRRREIIARKLVDEEEKRRDASGYFEVRSNDRLQWRAARLKRVTTEQQRLYALCGYIDDSHMAAVGRKRAFRLLVTFVSVSMRIGAVCAPDKFNFGQRLREEPAAPANGRDWLWSTGMTTKQADTKSDAQFMARLTVGLTGEQASSPRIPIPPYPPPP